MAFASVVAFVEVGHLALAVPLVVNPCIAAACRVVPSSVVKDILALVIPFVEEASYLVDHPSFTAMGILALADPSSVVEASYQVSPLASILT